MIGQDYFQRLYSNCEYKIFPNLLFFIVLGSSVLFMFLAMVPEDIPDYLRIIFGVLAALSFYWGNNTISIIYFRVLHNKPIPSYFNIMGLLFSLLLAFFAIGLSIADGQYSVITFIGLFVAIPIVFAILIIVIYFEGKGPEEEK